MIDLLQIIERQQAQGKMLEEIYILLNELFKKSELKTELKTEVMFTEDVCQLFKINNDRVSKWIRKGKLKKINPVGVKRNMFDKSAVYLLFENRRRKREEVQKAPAIRRKMNNYGIQEFK